MSRHKTLFALTSIAGLWLGATLTLADDASPPPPLMPRREFCQQNPAQCEADRAKRQEYCKQNPQKCEEMRQRRAQRREYCKQNPQQCQEQRAQMQARCAADPAKCQEMREQRRERFQQNGGTGGAAPQPAP